MANVAAAKTHTASNVVVIVEDVLCEFVEVVDVTDGVLLRDLDGGRGLCWPLSSITPERNIC